MAKSSSSEEEVPRPALAAGSTAHYADAVYYDRAYRSHRADVDFYLQSALEHGGPLLELGCGTGRITLPVARAGFEILGVDSSRAMLREAEAKLATQSAEVQRKVELLRQDIRRLKLERRFSLVISPFNVLQHLYSRDDIERCLAGVRRCLKPRGGRFVFDVLLPDVEALGRSPVRRYKLGKIYHPAGDKKYDYRESFDYDPVTQVEHITMYFMDPDDDSGSFATPLSHRQFFPVELEALLHYNGFELLERYGSFDREPLGEGSDSQVCVCRLRRGWA